MSRRSDDYLRGVPMKPYDLVREGLIALGFVAALVFVLAIVFKSPTPLRCEGRTWRRIILWIT